MLKIKKIQKADYQKEELPLYTASSFQLEAVYVKIR